MMTGEHVIMALLVGIPFAVCFVCTILIAVSDITREH